MLGAKKVSEALDATKTAYPDTSGWQLRTIDPAGQC
jgi:hypothetical protein